MRLLTMIVTSAMVLVSASSAVLAQAGDIWRAGARVHVVSSDHHDVWAAGAIVSVRGSVANELRAAGAEVSVDALVKGDAWVAGAIVSATGGSDKNLYVAGARVNVDAQVGGDLKVAGARVIVGPKTDVRGLLQVAGADVVFSGLSQGPAEIYGDAVQIDGRVAGNLLVRARSVTVGKSAVIDGNAVFETFDEPTIEEGATLRGQQTVTLPRPRVSDGWLLGRTLGGIALFGIGAGLVLGLILLIGARSFVDRTISDMRAMPVQNLLVGLAVLVLFPLAAILLMVTVIGIPVGFLALLAFPLLLLTASVIAAFGLSDWLFNRSRAERSFGSRFLLLLAGLALLVLVGLVPIVGFVTWLVAVVLGLGAVWHTLRNRPRLAGQAV